MKNPAEATSRRLIAGGVVAAVALAAGGVAMAEAGPVPQAERTKAGSAAARAVPGARLLEVHREREHRRRMLCAELQKGNYVYDVDLNRQFKVVEVERELDN